MPVATLATHICATIRVDSQMPVTHARKRPSAENTSALAPSPRRRVISVRIVPAGVRNLIALAVVHAKAGAGPTRVTVSGLSEGTAMIVFAGFISSSEAIQCAGSTLPTMSHTVPDWSTAWQFENCTVPNWASWARVPCPFSSSGDSTMHSAVCLCWYLVGQSELCVHTVRPLRSSLSDQWVSSPRSTIDAVILSPGFTFTAKQMTFGAQPNTRCVT